MPEGVLTKDEETVRAAIKPYTDATNTSAVGSNYKISAPKPQLTNYDVTIEDGVYTVTARSVTVTVKQQSVTYNQQLQSASSAEEYWNVADLAAKDKADCRLKTARP